MGRISGGSGPSQAIQAAIEAETNEDTYLPPDLLKHHPGVGKAWANFDQAVIVNGSYNVDSVTDVGVGDWTVVFTTDFSALGYLAIANNRDDSGGGDRKNTYAAEDAVGSCAVIMINTTDGSKADPSNANDDIHLICLGDFA